MSDAHWQLNSTPAPPTAFIQQVQTLCPQVDGRYAAKLLWQRGIHGPEQLAPFLHPADYSPTDSVEFGQEMKWAVQRLWQAREQGEIVTIWGDFDADGVTATAVLKEGLEQFFPAERLNYVIPNRQRESHGLNRRGLEQLAIAGTRLVVTCDTGSTNLDEIAYATELGLDVIVTDHHTLPAERPDVVAMINPRYFADSHPLYHLSGVAVAYKVMEALYQAFPHIPQQPITELLDLVAIGLIADLVQLSGDCRYLAQVGIKQLKRQNNPDTMTRPGVYALLQNCNRSGDRPTDIAFGIGPRINAISRIQGDARFGVELLTSRDAEKCNELAQQTEILNSRRKGLQKTVGNEVQQRLDSLDFSTTGVVVLVDAQWPTGILGLAASQIAQMVARPVVLLNCADGETARGSARSVAQIDLYELLYSQRHLLTGFGGHPFAAGLSLPLEQVPIFREAVNQQFWQRYGDRVHLSPQINIDLLVTVAELGKVNHTDPGSSLFTELNLLEPYGMGNPIPKLLLRNVQFRRPSFRNIKDKSGNKISYLQTTFWLKDASCSHAFPGIWWGHHPDELPPPQQPGQGYDVVVELDFNAHHQRYEVRLEAIRLHQATSLAQPQPFPEIIDRRSLPATERLPLPDAVPLRRCPASWTELRQAYQLAIARRVPLVLDYDFQPLEADVLYPKVTELSHMLPQQLSVLGLQKALGLSQVTAQSLMQTLQDSHREAPENRNPDRLNAQLWAMIQEDYFQRRYFHQATLTPELLS